LRDFICTIYLRISREDITPIVATAKRIVNVAFADAIFQKMENEQTGSSTKLSSGNKGLGARFDNGVAESR